MALDDLTSREAVLAAVDEFDRVGRERFLQIYGFREARTYFLRVEDRLYDSKAITGAAHGYEHPDIGPLRARDFSGGEAHAVRVLERLGFDIERVDASSADLQPEFRRGRNPAWAVDELILALDLYLDSGLLDDADPKVVELSEILNRLPIHTQRPDEERFRNPNGVSLKLANFAALDPSYPGTGMSRGGRRDAEVWDRYHNHPGKLRALAAALRAGISADEAFPSIPEDDEGDVPEGRLLYRRHRARERSSTLANRKKARAKAAGQLRCEACGFDFEATYGPLGRDYIECHHTRPLFASGPVQTRLADLALLCANCHRMAHRGYPWPTVDQLRVLVTRSRRDSEG